MTSYFGQHRILSPSIRLIIYSIQKETAKEYPQICKNIRKTELPCKIKIPRHRKRFYDERLCIDLTANIQAIILTSKFWDYQFFQS